MWEFNQSLKYDKRMYAQDVRGSIAYAKALCLRGLLTKDEEAQLVQGLTQVGEEWKNGQVCAPPLQLILCASIRESLNLTLALIVRDQTGRRGHPHGQRASPR